MKKFLYACIGIMSIVGAAQATSLPYWPSYQIGCYTYYYNPLTNQVISTVYHCQTSIPTQHYNNNNSYTYCTGVHGCVYPANNWNYTQSNGYCWNGYSWYVCGNNNYSYWTYPYQSSLPTQQYRCNNYYNSWAWNTNSYWNNNNCSWGY